MRGLHEHVGGAVVDIVWGQKANAESAGIFQRVVPDAQLGFASTGSRSSEFALGAGCGVFGGVGCGA